MSSAHLDNQDEFMAWVKEVGVFKTQAEKTTTPVSRIREVREEAKKAPSKTQKSPLQQRRRGEAVRIFRRPPTPVLEAKSSNTKNPGASSAKMAVSEYTQTKVSLPVEKPFDPEPGKNMTAKELEAQQQIEDTLRRFLKT